MTISLPEPQQRRTARIAGWLIAATSLTSIPAALILYDLVLSDSGYILGAGDDARVTLGALLEINGILLGWLMYRTGLMPPRLAMLGVIGGPLISASAIAVLFGAYEQDGLHALFSVPEGAFEPAFAISLIAKGFRPSPILDDARPLLAVWRTSGTIRLALGRRPGWGEIPREALDEAPAGALTPLTR